MQKGESLRPVSPFTRRCCGPMGLLTASLISRTPARTRKVRDWRSRVNRHVRAIAKHSAMISKPAPTECFVYITLPGATEAVTAARFVLTMNRGGAPLGRLVYGKSYLARADAVAFDPVELSLGPRVYETSVMKGVFGALRDASPDSWGRRVIE